MFPSGFHSGLTKEKDRSLRRRGLQLPDSSENSGLKQRVSENKVSVNRKTMIRTGRTVPVTHYQFRFSPSVDVVVKKDAVNPKRMQREAAKQIASAGIGTKSQQALQLQREENKLERKTISREQREAEKQRQFDLRQQKRKEKHRGR